MKNQSMKTTAAMNRKKMRKARERKNLVLFLGGATLLLVGVLALVFLPRWNASQAGANNPSPYTPAKVKFAAPELSLYDLNGEEVSLSDYLGKVVLVNNWATWCPPCRAEMPILEAYYQDHQTQDFILIGIEAGEPAVQVETFVEGYGITFPIWLDPEQKALKAFRNDALPSTYVIDRDGIVRLVWSGVISREALDQYVTPMLNE